MKLYVSIPGVRSHAFRCKWLLEELGVAHELVKLDFSKGEHRTPAYLAIHPVHQIPALVDGDTTVFESVAINLYLADKFADKKLAPLPSAAERATYLQWSVFSVATLERPVSIAYLHTHRLPPEQRSEQVKADAQARFMECADGFAKCLGARPFILGDHLTAADVSIGAVLASAQDYGWIEGTTLRSYLDRLSRRPAYQRSLSWG